MLRKLLAACLLAPLAVACAPSAQAETPSLSPEQLALVDTTCAQVIGLKPGEAYFADCRDSLSQALVAKTQDEAVDYQACHRQGLADGTASFSTCMLDRQSSKTVSRNQPMAIANTGNGDTQADKSFYEVAPSVRWSRERYACAQLGLLPGRTYFGQCLAGLQGAFWPSPN
jgi:hypothetical protein